MKLTIGIYFFIFSSSVFAELPPHEVISQYAECIGALSISYSDSTIKGDYKAAQTADNLLNKFGSKYYGFAANKTEFDYLANFLKNVSDKYTYIKPSQVNEYARQALNNSCKTLPPP